MKKITSLIAIVMFLLAIIPSNNIQIVEAAQKNVCEETMDGNFCVESEDISFTEYGGCIEGRLRTGQTLTNLRNEAGGACQVGTCIPGDGGQCIDSKTRIECEEQGGEFESNPIEEVASCQIGCCKTNSQCGIKELNFCNWEDGTFFSGITGVSECNMQCQTQNVGCFKPADSPNCEFNVQQEFTSRDGQFYSGQYCRQVVGCKTYRDTSEETYQSCGNGITNDDQRNVYVFDAQGNREDLKAQCGADEVCVDPDEDAVGTIHATCQPTSCYMPKEGEDFYPSQFRSGESLCVNVLSGHFDNDKISKALDNYMLACENGEIKAIYPDEDKDDREFRCEEITDVENENRITGNWVDNEWEQCSSCGQSNFNPADVLGYAPIIGPPLVNAFGNSCDNGGWPLGGTECSSLGDCGGGPLSTKDYDGDFLWSPIGSCNPEYPPATSDKCGDCGKGGDGVSNVCTQAECNALGDCKFEEGGAAGYGTTTGLAVGVLTTGIAMCQATRGFPGIYEGCMGLLIGTSLNAGTSGTLFWSAMSLIYGAGAQGNTANEENPGEAVKELKEGDKYRLISHLIVGKSLGRLVNEEQLANEASESIDDGTFFSWWLAAPTGVITLDLLRGYIPDFARYAFADTVSSGLPEGGLLKVPNELVGKVAVGAGFVLNYVSVSQSFETGSCVPEAGYGNSQYCGDCGPGEGQWYCKIERCAAIGGGSVTAEGDLSGGYCQYVPFEDGNKDDGLCIQADPNDKNAPFVQDIKVEFQDADNKTIGQVYSATGKSLKIDPVIDQDAVKLNVNLTMNELTSSCGFSRTAQTAYSETEKVFEYNAKAPSQYAVIELTDSDRIKGDTGEEIRFYFKCKDFLGNEASASDDSNYISFKMDERPDLLPPEIKYIDPVRTTFPEDTSTVNLNLIAYDKNEVAECRYSTDCEINPDTLSPECAGDYNEMTVLPSRGDTSCTTVDATCQKFGQTITLTPEMKQTISIGDGSLIEGYESISGENAQTLDMYALGFKCKDGASTPNINDVTYPWSIIVVPGFSLSIEQPEEGQQVWNETVDLEILTSSPTICTMELDGEEQNLTSVVGGYDYEHVTTLTDLGGAQTGRNYDLHVTCQDIGQNERTASTNFIVYSDETPPSLLRIWTASNTLNVLLDEKATCYYSTTENDFELVNASTKMAIKPDQRTHYTSINKEVYYIACEDIWDNVARYTIHP